MTKQTIFSLSVSSLRGSMIALTSLIAMLGLVLGMFMYTSPAYAESPINVAIKSLGNAKSATIFAKGEQASQCATGNSLLAINVTGKKMFSVNFFSSSDCSGKRKTPFFRYTVPEGQKLFEIFRVTCQSDTDCKEGYG